MEGKSSSEALNLAMNCMRKSREFSAVNHWAPFVLIGDDVTLEFDGSKKTTHNVEVRVFFLFFFLSGRKVPKVIVTLLIGFFLSLLNLKTIRVHTHKRYRPHYRTRTQTRVTKSTPR